MAHLTRTFKKFRISAARPLKPLMKVIQGTRSWHLLILTIVLIIASAYLLNLITTQTFKAYFNCEYLIDRPLHTNKLCAGYSIDFGMLGKWEIIPRMNVINTPLEGLRKFVAWNIVLFFALVSIVLSFIILKVVSFVKYVLTPQGRRVVLTSLSVWLFIFAALCLLFYINIVV